MTSANKKPSKPQADDLTVTPGGRNGVVATFEYSPEPGQWTAAGEVARGTTGLVIARLEMRPGPDATGGVTGGMMRKIQVGELLAAIRNRLATEALSVFGMDSQEVIGELLRLAREVAAESREGSGRIALDDALLRDIALIYLSETRPGSPPGAMKRMAEMFGRPEETVRTWVARARRGGWLGPSVKGRTGAEPGPRLLEPPPDLNAD